MAITPAEFQARFTEFVSVSDPRIQTFIDKALLNLDEGVWGNYFVEGQLYLTAHFLTLAEISAKSSSGSAGLSPLASKSIGDVSYSFATGTVESGSETYFQATTYGQEYWRLCKIVGAGIVAII